MHAKDVPPPCTIGYSQTMDASPTETSTVYTLLKPSVAFCDQLSQEDVVIVLDQAKEIIWQCPNEFRRVTLRMGAFYICCNFLGLLGQRYGDAGLSQQKPRAVDVNALVGTLGHEVCRSLVGLHSITGTDTTSAFSGKGKQAGFHLVQTDALARKTMTLIGDKWNVTEELQTLYEMFVIHLYGLKIQSIDEARYVLFCTKNHLSQQLPPTRDALRNHVKRANYQAAIWKHALKAKADIPSPDGHGWTLCDNTLQVHWMDAEPAPHALMQLASCGCKTECGTRRCSCRASDLGCTDACKCPISCRNQRATFVEDYVLDTPENLP